MAVWRYTWTILLLCLIRTRAQDNADNQEVAELQTSPTEATSTIGTVSETTSALPISQLKPTTEFLSTTEASSTTEVSTDVKTQSETPTTPFSPPVTSAKKLSQVTTQRDTQ